MGSAAPAFQTRRPSYCSWCWLQQLLLHLEILMMEGMKLRRERQRQGIIHIVAMEEDMVATVLGMVGDMEDMEGTVDMEGMVVVIMARDLLRLRLDMDMVDMTMAKDLLSLDMVVVMEEDMVVAMDPDMVA